MPNQKKLAPRSLSIEPKSFFAEDILKNLQDPKQNIFTYTPKRGVKGLPRQ